jgi:cytohesin
MPFSRISYAAAVIVSTAAIAMTIGGCDGQPAGGSSTTAATTGPAATGQTRSVVQRAPSTADSEPATLLYRALLYRNLPVVQNILERNPDLANAEMRGTRPLAIACESRNLELVRLVIEKGADVNAKAADGWSILFYAVQNDSVEIAKYLILKGANPTAREVDGETLLWGAPSKEMAEFLISRGVDPKATDKDGDTALHAACRKSRRDVVEVLLNAGLHVETVGKWKMRPLHSAACTLTGEPRPVVNLLIQRGANLNSRGFEGRTALHETAFFNCPQMTELLLTNGADPNLKDRDGKKPIDVAIKEGKLARATVINLLVKYGGGTPDQMVNDQP